MLRAGLYVVWPTLSRSLGAPVRVTGQTRFAMTEE